MTVTDQPLRPSHNDLDAARSAFEANEPRDLFYRAATELVDFALRRTTSLTVAEALAVLLQTWNRAYYQYRRLDSQHFHAIEELVGGNLVALEALRPRAIDSLAPDDEAQIRELFTRFERVLGPVGAAKSLHLLAPRFFPLWDRAIAEVYALPLSRAGTNAVRYYAFMLIVRAQAGALGGEAAIGRNPLKAIDEFNYCRFTKGWIP